MSKVSLSSASKGTMLTLFSPELVTIAPQGFQLRGYERVGETGLVQEWLCSPLTHEEERTYREREPTATKGAHGARYVHCP